MHAKTTHRTAAFVLRVLDYGESDRIVTFYTEDFGKLKGIAKGAKRSRRRFANALEPFSCLEILFSRRGRTQPDRGLPPTAIRHAAWSTCRTISST